MNPEEIREARERLELTRHEFAEFLGLSGYRSEMQIELGTRRPNKLAIKVIYYLNSLSKARALAFIEEINRHEHN